MLVESVHNIRGRGTVIVVTLPEMEMRGKTLLRESDQKTWTIRSIESQGVPRPGKKVGLHLGGAEPPTVGDEVHVVTGSPSGSDDNG